MKYLLKPVLLIGTAVLGLAACSSGSTNSESASNEMSNNEGGAPLVDEEQADVIEEFSIRFLDEDRNPITSFQLDQKIYVDVTYPTGFVRNTFNLYEFSLMAAERGISFASLMIPYAELVEREGGLLMAFELESGEDMDMNLKFHKDGVDEEGNIRFYGMVKDNSLFLPSSSDTITLHTK